MNVPEITEIKDQLEQLKTDGLIAEWELPYENLLTRRDAAFFFVEFKGAPNEEVWETLSAYPHFSYRMSASALLSSLSYQITFSEEEKQKNEAAMASAAG